MVTPVASLRTRPASPVFGREPVDPRPKADALDDAANLDVAAERGCHHDHSVAQHARQSSARPASRASATRGITRIEAEAERAGLVEHSVDEIGRGRADAAVTSRPTAPSMSGTRPSSSDARRIAIAASARRRADRRRRPDAATGASPPPAPTSSPSSRTSVPGGASVLMASTRITASAVFEIRQQRQSKRAAVEDATPGGRRRSDRAAAPPPRARRRRPRAARCRDRARAAASVHSSICPLRLMNR